MMIRRVLVAMSLGLFLLPGAAPQTSPEERIGVLCQQFLEAFGRRDLAATLAFWNLEAAAFPAARQDLRRTLAPNSIRVVLIGPARTVVSGDTARSQVQTNFEVADALNGTLVPGFGIAERIIEWVVVNGEWKITRYMPAEQEFAQQLAAAKPADAAALLTKPKQPGFSIWRLVRALSNLANTKAEDGDFAAAIRLSDLAIQTATTLDDKASLANARQRRANMYFDRSELESARSEYSTALSLSVAANDTRGEGSAHHGLAKVHIWMYRFPQGLQELETCRRIAKTTADRWLESDCVNTLGEANRRMGDFPAANANFEAGRKLAVELGDRNGEAIGIENLANVLAMQGRYTEALEQYQRGLAMEIEEHSQDGQAITLGNMGSSLEAAGRYAEAMDALNRSLEIKQRLGDKGGTALTLNNIGNVLVDQGKYDEAMKQYQASLDLGATIPDKGVQAQASNNMASAYQLKGDYGAAFRWYRVSEDLERENKNDSGIAVSQGGIAQLQTLTGHFPEALATFTHVRALFHSAGLRSEEAVTLVNLATLERELGHYQKAKELYRAALELQKAISDQQGQILTYQGLAVLYQRQGSPVRALDSAMASESIATRIGAAGGRTRALLTAGDILRRTGRLKEAEDDFNTVLLIAASSGITDAHIAAKTGLGLISAARLEWDRAAASCSDAVAKAEQMRYLAATPYLQMGVVAGNQAPYDCLVAAETGRKRNMDAFRAAEAGRARSLMDVLSRGKAEIDRGLTDAEKEKIRILDTTAASIYASARQTPSPEMEKLLELSRGEADTYRRLLYVNHPELAAKRGETAVIDAATLGSLLRDENTAVLEYVIGDEQSWVFVVRRHAGEDVSVSVHAVPARARDLERICASYVYRLSRKDPAPPEASELYRILLAPAATELQGVATLGIVPDQSTWQVPFAALRSPDGKFVVQSRATFYAPSLSALASMHRTSLERTAKSPDDKSILIVANPSLGPTRRFRIPLRGTVEELPSVNTETSSIAKLFPQSTILPGVQASEGRVREQLPLHRYIHFTAHGFLDSTDPMYSGVVLAQPPGQGEDGILEAREIAQMDIPAELVVLAACQSGEGDVLGGEGIVGLSWSLFAAGSPSSILTKWKVSNAASSLMMPAFYRGMTGATGSPETKARALQIAQLGLLNSQDFRNPYYWAPYVLTGVWQ